MRRPFVILGAIALGSGAAMNILLGQLRSDFFRAYLPPWVYVSYVAMAAGAVVAIAGVALKPIMSNPMSPPRAAGLTARLALLNAGVAAALLAPVLVPSFRFPILITQWPGIYMILAYFSFVTVGVLGMVAWTVIYTHLADLFKNGSLASSWFWVQIVVTQVGVYGLTVSMFLGGYTGSWLAYNGAGPVAVGAQMEFSVIPSAVSIFMVAAGTIVGVVNMFVSGRSAKV